VAPGVSAIEAASIGDLVEVPVGEATSIVGLRAFHATVFNQQS